MYRQLAGQITRHHDISMIQYQTIVGKWKLLMESKVQKQKYKREKKTCLQCLMPLNTDS